MISKIDDAKRSLEMARQEVYRTEQLISDLEDEENLEVFPIEYSIGYERGKNDQFVVMVVLILVSFAIGAIIGRLM